MSKKKALILAHAGEIVLSSLAVALSISVFVFPQLEILTLIFMLSIALLVGGIAEMLAGIFTKYLSGVLRVLSLGVGMLTLFLASMTLGYPPVSIRVLINLLSFGQLANGIAGVGIGAFTKTLVKRFRALLIVGSLLTIVLLILILVHQSLSSLNLVYLLAISFLLYGVARFALRIKRPQRVGTQ